MPDAELIVVLKLKDDFSKQVKRTGKIFANQSRRMRRSMDGVSRSIRRAVLLFAGFHAARAVFRSVVVGAFRFEKQMAEVATLIEDTTVNMAGLSDELINIGVQFGQTPKALSKGLYDALSAGLVTAKNSMQFMADASLLANAGVTDVARSVDLLTSVMNSFNIPAEQAMDVMDTLFQTVKLGKTTIIELTGSIGRVAPVAARAGITLEETGAALAVMTKSGLSTEEAATALRQALVQLISLTKEQAEVAEAAGLEMSLAALRTKGLTKFMRDLNRATGGSLDKIGKLIPNVRALTGVASLAADDAKVLAFAFELMANKAGAAERAAAKVLKTASVQFDRFRAAVFKLTNSFGEVLLPGFAAALGQMADEISEFVDENSDSIEEFTKNAVKSFIRFARAVGDIFQQLGGVLDLFFKFQGLRFAIQTQTVAFLANIAALISGNKELDSAANALQEYNRAILLSVTGQKDLTTAYQEAEIAIVLYNQELGLGDGLVGGYSRSMSALNRAFETFEANLGRVERPLKKVKEQFRQMTEFGPQIGAGVESANALAVIRGSAERQAALASFEKQVEESMKRTQGTGPTVRDIGFLFQLQNAEEMTVEMKEQTAELIEQSQIRALQATLGDEVLANIAFQRAELGEMISSFESIVALGIQLTEEQEATRDAAQQLAVILKTIATQRKEEIKTETKEAVTEFQGAIEQSAQLTKSTIARSIIDGVTEGTEDAQDVLRNFLKSIANMFLQAGFSAAGASLGLPGFAAEGGVFNTGNSPVRKMAEGGITSGPEVVVRGEGGPEAVIPLSRGRQIPIARLSGGRGLNVNVGGVTIRTGSDTSPSTVARLAGRAVEEKLNKDPRFRNLVARAVRSTL